MSFRGPVLPKVIYDPSFHEEEDSASPNSEKEKRPPASAGTVGIALQVLTGFPESKKPKS
jgi:hypothetical protein